MTRPGKKKGLLTVEHPTGRPGQPTDLQNSCSSKTVFLCRQRLGSRSLRYHRACSFLVVPAGVEEQELVLRSTWGTAVCTRVILPLLSHLTSWKGSNRLLSSKCNSYGESVYTIYFHFASTWWLLFFLRVLCFLSYQVLFMLKLGKACTHSMHALPSWAVSISYFCPAWLKMVVLGNKEVRPRLGCIRCVATQGV